MATEHQWSVTVRDESGRRRAITVEAAGGKVNLIGPSGEVSELAPLDVGRLRAALRDAVVASEATAAPVRRAR